MKKSFKLFIVFTIALLAIPFQNIALISAGEKVYDNIKDGTYEITAKAFKDGTNESSAAADFLEESAKLVVQNGNSTLIISQPHVDGLDFYYFDIEGAQSNTSTEGDVIKHSFDLTDLKRELNAVVSYKFLTIIDHEDVKLDFVLEGLDDLPVIEENVPEEEPEEDPESEGDEGSDEENGTGDEGETGGGEEPEQPEQPEYEPAEDERVIGNLVTEDEADDVYELEFDSDSPATKGQLQNPVKLLVKDNEEYVQIPVNAGGAGFFKSLKFNGEEVTWNNTSEAPYVIQYKLKNGIQDTIDVSMVIDTGSNVMPHDNIKLWFNLEDQRVTGELITEAEADSVEVYEYGTDSRATAGQLQNPVKVLEKDNKQYVQIPINDRGAQFFKSLRFNGEEVVWNNITEAPHVIQYELPDGFESNIDVSMIIDTGRAVMPHGNIKLWLENRINEATLGEKVEVKENDKVIIEESKDYVKMPENLPANTNVTIENKTTDIEKYNINGDLDIAGQVYDFEFEGLDEDYSGEFEISLAYDKAYSSPEYYVDIYYYDESKKEWIAQGGKAENGQVTATVSHFSTYGVFAKEVLVDSDEKYEANYVSSLNIDKRFDNPVTVVELDGKKYIQMNGHDAKYIRSLELNGKELTLHNMDEDGNYTIQFEVENLADVQKFTMNLVNVPGIGDISHTTDLYFETVVVEEEDEKDKTEPTPTQEVVDPKEVDAAYTIDYTILQEAVNEKSVADEFFERPAILLEKDGVYYVQITTNANQYIEALSNHFGNFIKVDGDENGLYTYQFRIAGELTDAQIFEMVINVPGVYENQDHTARIVLDVNSMNPINAADYELALGTKTNANGPTVEDQVIPNPPPTPKPTPEPKPTPGKGDGQGTEKTQVVENPKKVDSAYKINFTIYDESGKEVSVADGFFNKPAILLKKGDVYYVQITTNSNQFIDSLSNRFGEFLKVGGDENGVFTYQFRVHGDLTDAQIIDMVITVEGIYEQREHTTRLVLDVDSMVPVNADDYELVLGTAENANGPGTGGAGGKTPEKPTLGNGENGSDTKKDSLNPQTGDTTAIVMYSLLLLAAATGLFLQLRRRFAKQ